MVKYFSELILFGPYSLPDFLYIFGLSIIFLSDGLANLVEILVFESHLLQVVLQIHRVVRLMWRRLHEDAVGTDLSVAVQTVKVILVVVQRAMRLA